VHCDVDVSESIDELDNSLDAADDTLDARDQENQDSVLSVRLLGDVKDKVDELDDGQEQRSESQRSERKRKSSSKRSECGGSSIRSVSVDVSREVPGGESSSNRNLENGS